MEIAIALLIAWAVITLLGHLSWVLVRGFFRLITGVIQPPVSPDRPDKTSDIAAARRVILRLTSNQLLDERGATELRRQLRDLEYGQTTGTMHPATTTEQPSVERPDDFMSSSWGGQEPAPGEPFMAELVVDQPTEPKPPTPPAPQAPVQPPSPPAAAGEPSPFSAPVKPAPEIAQPAPTPAVPLPPPEPALSKAQIVQSFLAAHNIRWGELVAGLLIVACSIGLVISLWTDLVETHRVVPSLIFLAANAAIYAAGLYTLSRWRLRHTSRAVLVIATLLVPLSVLAGLAAAGTGEDAVQLNDPVTWGAIAVAGVVYTVLLYWGGKALLQRAFAVPIVIAVGGPVSILPLMPAAVRTLQGSAGWMLLIASIGVLLSSVRLIHRKRSDLSLGIAGARARLLVMSFGGFSLAVATGYAAFLVRSFGTDATLAIAIAVIPGVVALAGLSRLLMKSARSSTLSLTGASLCAIFIGLTWAALPPALRAFDWLWYWAGSLSVSLWVVGWLAKTPRAFAVATLPLGMAVTFSSPVWMGDLSWHEVAFWRRVVGGEPMIAAALVAVAVGLLSRLVRAPGPRQWMEYAAMFWVGLVVITASILSVAPPSLLGVAPEWSVTCVLAVGAITCVVFSMQNTWGSSLAIAATVFTWLSVFRPIAWDEQIGEPRVWMMTLLAISTTLLVFAELVPRLAAMRSLRSTAAIRSAGYWQQAAASAAVLATLVACFTEWRLFAGLIPSFGPAQGWQESAATLAAASGLLFWTWTLSRHLNMLRYAQASTVALAVVIDYGHFAPSLYSLLYSIEAWSDGIASWGWAIISAVLAGTWILIRAVADILATKSSGARRRLAHLSDRSSAPRRMFDGGVAAIAVALIVLGSGWCFLDLLCEAHGKYAIVYAPPWWMPTTAFALGTVMAVSLRFRSIDLVLSNHLLSWIVVSAFVWGSSELAQAFSIDASRQLVLATTLIAGGCFAVSQWLLPRWDTGLAEAIDRLSLATATCVIAISSAMLLAVGWYEPIVADSLADKFNTLAVASWWMAASIALLWKSRSMIEPGLTIASAILAPASVALAVPAFTVSQPIVWVQVAGITSIAWIAAARWWLKSAPESLSRLAIDASWLFAFAFGVGSAALVTLHVVSDIDRLQPVCGAASFILSLLAVGLWCIGWIRLPRPWDDRPVDKPLAALPWPLGASLLSGQIAWLASELNLISGVQLAELAGCVALVASAASLIRYRMSASRLDFVHVTAIAIALVAITADVGVTSTMMPWLALLSLVICGLQITLTAIDAEAGRIELAASRLLGWFVIVAGSAVIIDQITSSADFNVRWTVTVMWCAAWVTGWRVVSYDRFGEEDRRDRSVMALADMEFAFLLLIGLIGETVLLAITGDRRLPETVWGDPLLWGRVIAYLAASLSGMARVGRTVAWSTSLGTLVGTASMVFVQIAIHFDASESQRFVWAMLPAGFSIALVSHWLRTMAKLIAKYTGGSVSMHVRQLAHSTWQVSGIVGGSGAAATITMVVGGAPAADAQLCVVAVALSAWAMAVTAESCDWGQLRHAAVAFFLGSIGLWATIDSGQTSHPALTASMRWLVASVLTIPTLLFAFPKLVGARMAERWSEALQRGAAVGGLVSGGSLIAMLTMETLLRDEKGIDDIEAPLVIGVAVTLGVLSLLAGIIAILSGPRSSWRESIPLSNGNRRILIVAAQAVAGITWLHVFLCNTEWAFIGIRGAWPYFVMGLAFVSVGASEWAKRREDTVLAGTLAHTALYLPLIPVIGFWLSGSIAELGWAFRGGVVRYDVLLAIGSIYYICISALWKKVMTRVAAIVLANAAWWVVLVQQPGWGFLAHPQVWMIPPAVCVLVIVHLYRNRLDERVTSAVRYAGTLVIYISSTADMLIQEIGTSLAGPIVLVLLALLGMAAGVALRVRPFLYLGALFVLLGVTSMVWHANRAFDAVWPWWAFGITTGILLLAGLMLIEKNKPQLRRYAENLASWQG